MSIDTATGKEAPADISSARVKDIFSAIAKKYERFNAVSSFGAYKAWLSGMMRQAPIDAEADVLDIAGGTGDLALAFAKKVGPMGQVVHTDINEAMLRIGRDRLLDAGVILPTAVCDAEKLPFPDGHFDLVSVAFGLRNMTHKDAALREMARVLKPGGKLLVLEFSQVAKPLRKAYDVYSFSVLPRLGRLVAGDADSYRYLAESIRMHPNQQELKALMKSNGFGHVDFHNMAGGVVALHVGIKCG